MILIRIRKRQPVAFGLAVAVLGAGLFIGLDPRPLAAQSGDANGMMHHLNRRFFSKMAFDFGRTVTSPGHWNGKDFWLCGGAVATTAAVMFGLDHGTREWVEDNQKTGFTGFSLFITHFGEAPVLLGLSAFFYGGGEVLQNDGWRRTGLLCLESYIIDGIIVTGAKLLFARSRPTIGEGVSGFHWFSFKNSQHSFPSGHSASAFAVASVIAGESDSLAVGIAAYGLASLVAISRVNNNEHWASDVVAGSILGYFVGKQVLALNKPSSRSKPTLALGPARGGFALSVRF